MDSNTSSNFSIYRSSAGSGKTYTLAREFVTLAIKNPNLFNKILAVTFTNKATKEMKERILHFLVSLSAAKDDDLLESIMENTGLGSKEVVMNASTVINKVLHQYSQFSVSTIDAFFQKVVKSFARELGLFGNFRVELDQDKVKQDIIDQILEDIGENEDLTNWLVEFSLAKVDENKSWNIRPQIEILANEVFKESFRPVSKQLSTISHEDFNSLLAQLKAIKVGFERHIKSLAERGLKVISQHHLFVEDFAYKSAGPAGYFENVMNGRYQPGKRIQNALENPEGWSSKTSLKKDEIMLAVNSGLHDIANEIIAYYQNQYVTYNSANEALKHIYVFGILSRIIEKLNNYRLENDVMLISDIPVFLQGIIAENEAPFIYEKSGAWYQHYLIDEFQDTSGFQWQNFRPLVENGLSQGNESLLVGDGKQSIYRWRGGDWNLILNEVQEDLHLFSPDVKKLDTNWRSAYRIVKFNNAVFSFLPKQIEDYFTAKMEELSLEEDLKSFFLRKAKAVKDLYQDVAQKVPDKQKIDAEGMIEINAFQKNSEKSWKENSLDELPVMIERIQALGVQARDIAVLVRRGIEGKQVLEKLIKYKHSDQALQETCYDAISNESLFLGNSSSIRLIINTITYCLNREDKIAFGEICLNFKILQEQREEEQDLSFILEGKSLPENFEATCDQLISLPAYEMIERIIQLFHLGKSEHKGYLQAFQDAVLEYFADEKKDINDFLDWWNEKGKRKSIQLPESINAIQVMTIHKSKGLEFKAVLIPFCDWKLDHETNKANFLWCKSSQKPYCDFGYLPVKYSSALANSYFAQDYFDEMISAHIDNLNLLYVALTRAQQILFINCPPQGNGLNNSGDLVLKALEDMLEGDVAGLEISIQNHEDDCTSYTLGQPEKITITSAPAVRPLKSNYKSGDWRKKIALRRKGGIFMTESGMEKKEKINYGLIVHEILAGIGSEQEVEMAIDRYYLEGQISKDDKQLLTGQLQQIFADPQVQEWFNTSWEVKAEVPIILRDRYPIRPDRVLIRDNKAIVIDFKTGQEKPADKRQILSYRGSLLEMGIAYVECYLLYISQNKVVKVG